MASAKQLKPANETCPQEQPRFWGSMVFGGQKHNSDQQAVKEPQHGGWWFSQKQTAAAQDQHCSTPDKNPKPTCDVIDKKEHIIGVTVTKEKITNKGGNGIPKHATITEVRTEKQAVAAKREEHATNSLQAKGNVCTDANTKHKKDEQIANHSKSNVVSAAPKKKAHKDQQANHCFRTMADQVKQRISMMRTHHDHDAVKYSDSSSDSEDDKAEKKKKAMGHPQGTKVHQNEKTKK